MLTNALQSGLRPLARSSIAPEISSRPVLFVRPGMRQRLKLNADGLPDDLEEALLSCHEGPDIWVLGGYLRLRNRGYNVELADDFRPGALCVAHRDVVHRKIPRLWRSFVVGIRADRERIFTCDVEVVQSPASIEGPNAFYVLHWPQPAIRPRDPSRGMRLARLGYFGHLKNLAAEYRHPDFLAELASLGIELVVRDDPAQWSDYSDIDLVLAVRDGSPYFLASKPAIKLFNAWQGGCPAICGAEPAFHHHKESEFDFMSVSSAQDTLDHLRRLRSDPDHYARFLERARERARDVTEDKVVQEWVHFFEAVAMPRYVRWSLRPAPLRYAGSLVALAWKVCRQILRGKLYARGYDLDGRPIPERRNALRRAALAIDAVLTGLERRALARAASADPSRRTLDARSFPQPRLQPVGAPQTGK